MQPANDEISPPSSFAAWAGRIAEACELVAALEPLAAELGLPDAGDSDWHGALFGKLMEDSGSVSVIAKWMVEKLGTGRAILAVVLAGALVTYGGVSLFVAFFVLAPMAQELFRSAGIPRRLMPAAIVLGTSTFTMSALPGTPS